MRKIGSASKKWTATFLISCLILVSISSCKKCYVCTKEEECTRLNVIYFNGSTHEFDNKTICSADFDNILNYQVEVALAYTQFQFTYPDGTITETVSQAPKIQNLCGTKKENESSINELTTLGYICKEK